MRYIVLCHPLIRVLSSLGTDSYYFCCSAEVDLQPLVPRIVFCGPGPHETAAATVMKTSEISSVVHIPHGRGCDHVIFETARLNSHWSVTEWTYNQNVDVIFWLQALIVQETYRRKCKYVEYFMESVSMW